MSTSQKQLYFYSPEGLALVKHTGVGTSALVRAAGQALAQRDDGKTAFYGVDGQGSVCLFSSRSLQYTVYGQDRDVEYASLLRYNGQRKESFTGHYLLGDGYRAFNPALMRFNSPDNFSPMGVGGINCYAYCGGDPVNNTDPSGHRHFSGISKAPKLSTIWEVPEIPRLPRVQRKLTSTRQHAGVAKDAISLNPDFLNDGRPAHSVSQVVIDTIDELGRGYGNQIQPIMNARIWSQPQKLLVQGTALKLSSNMGELIKRDQIPGYSGNPAAAPISSQSRLSAAFEVISPLNEKMQNAESFKPVTSWLYNPNRLIPKVRDPGKTG